MRIVPKSLFGRLLGISAMATIAALIFAAFSIGHVLERFVIRGLDQQLDAQIGILARAVRSDGTLDPARVIDLPAFEQAGSGWSWRVDSPVGHWSRGGDIEVRDLPGPPGRPGHAAHGGVEEGPRPGDGREMSGEPVHFRQLSIPTSIGSVSVTAAGPRRVALRPLREAMVPLIGSLALLGAGLVLSTLVQLRIGLRPLRRLRLALADVRAGRARHVPSNQPVELAPLAAELNALVDQNIAGLAHARRHVSNLAHGLKTPLAALSIRLAESDSDPDGSLADMVRQIDDRVRHHLGRARAAPPGEAARARTSVAAAVAELDHALERIHAERAIDVSIAIADTLEAAVDPQDLDEMVGNLLDNAWRHARTTIGVAAARVGSVIVLTIDDDGPGLTEADISQALLPGKRLDERGGGHGFGLSITEELAALNGGALGLCASPIMSGLRAILRLPASL